MLLFSTMGPVSQVPDGTSMTPPPAVTAAAIAFLNAVVFSVVPFPTAPKLVMLKMLHGMVGGVNVTLPHGAATVTGAVFRQLQVPTTGSETVLTSSGGASPMHPAISTTQAPTNDVLFIP